MVSRRYLYHFSQFVCDLPSDRSLVSKRFFAGFTQPDRPNESGARIRMSGHSRSALLPCSLRRASPHKGCLSVSPVICDYVAVLGSGRKAAQMVDRLRTQPDGKHLPNV